MTVAAKSLMTATPGNARTEAATLEIQGLSCASCAARIERGLRGVPGVVDADVNYAAATLALRFDGAATDVGRLQQSVARLGYAASLPRNGARDEGEENETLWLRVRLAVAVFFGMNAMLPTIVVYLGTVDTRDRDAMWWLALASGVLTTPIVFFSGWPFLARAARSVWARAPGMDLLVATGALATFAYSAVALARGSSDVYFDTAGWIVTFLLVGRSLEAAAGRRSISAVRLLHALAPDRARVDVEGAEVWEPTARVGVGAHIRVLPGERIPLDGRIVRGSAHVDRSLLTGESMPVRVGPGDTLEAGTLDHDGALVLEVTGAVGFRALDRIARAVDDLLAKRAPMQALADRVASKLTVGVLVIATLTGLGLWLLTHDAAGSLGRAVAVTVIACPCALGLATPMAVLVAAGLAARRGILFRDGAALERAGEVTAVFLDKTGTITEGHPRVVGVLAAPLTTEEHVLACAAIAETGSEHPIARAILAGAAIDLAAVPPGTVRVEPGGGVRWVGQEREIRVGTAAFVGATPLVSEPATPSTVVHVAENGLWRGMILVTPCGRGHARPSAGSGRSELASRCSPETAARSPSTSRRRSAFGRSTPAARRRESARRWTKRGGTARSSPS